ATLASLPFVHASAAPAWPTKPVRIICAYPPGGLTDQRGKLALALPGGVLMLHDWKDRSIGFERGRGTQP
ncbi:hypothetical protein ABTN31_19725, partial [Acinetobacter baumannii]